MALYLEDLRCTACVWLVESAPRCVPGASAVRVDMGRSRADVTWDPRRTKLSVIARFLDGVGHTPHPYRGLDRDVARRREDRALLVKIGVAGAAMGNLMLLAVALYAGLFQGMTRADATLFRWASMIVAVPALGFAASPLFRTALGALRARRLHLDLPLSIAIVAGLGWGAVNVVRGVGEIYFDSLSMLVFLLLVARSVVMRHQRRASSSAELLLALTPSRARRLVGAQVFDVPIAAIVPDDVVVVLVGDVVPVDGLVVDGYSTLDVGLLTGESRPRRIAVGDLALAGTVNLAAPLHIRATAVGEATRVGKLVTTVEALSTRRAPIERHVDRIAGRFVAVVAVAAGVTGILWTGLVSASAGAEAAIALLIVTCPCALALATPLAVTVALGRAARRGILIKGADALERLATPGTLVVDKTGTLTAGALAVVTWRGDLDAAALAAAVEAGSTHPIARAIGAHAERDGAAPVARATAIEATLGRGIAGSVAGQAVLVGAPDWIRVRAQVAPVIEGWIAELAERGESPVAVAVDGTVVAVMGLADPVRPDSAAALAALAGLGWRVELVSGDDARVALRVGTALGLPPEACHGGVSPEGKAAFVVAALARGPTVMVGDGVNDAAAMAAASAGIAVAGSAEIAIDVADVYLRSSALTDVVAVARGAQATLATIRRNLGVSLVYNLAAGTLAITGLVHPLIAAIAMPLSSLTVLASSLRSRAFQEPS